MAREESLAASLPARPRAPVQIGASRWRFPDPASADPDGIVGIGADLAPETLVHAYRHGIFPWPHTGIPLPWFSPDPRGVIPLDGLRVPRSLRQRLRRCDWHTTVGEAFPAVIAACSIDREAEGTWITPQMRAAFQRLHDLGWAHSVEVWDGPDLIGGLYGVLVGGVFTGESMFHRVDDASKAALVDLVDRLAGAGGCLIDVQLTTPHLAKLGVRDMPRTAFLSALAAGRDADVRLPAGPRPVRRLANVAVGGRRVT